MTSVGEDVETGASCAAGGRPWGTRCGGASETERGVLPGCRGPASGSVPQRTRSGDSEGVCTVPSLAAPLTAPEGGGEPPGQPGCGALAMWMPRRGRTRGRHAEGTSPSPKGEMRYQPRMRDAWRRRDREEGAGRCRWGRVSVYCSRVPVWGREEAP